MILLKNDEIIDFWTWLPTDFSALKMFKLKMLFNFQKPVTTLLPMTSRTVTLWQTAICFVYKLSLNCRSFQEIAGCPPDSSSSRTAHQHNAQRRKLTAGQLSRFHQKRPMACKFAECKLGGLSRVVCNVGAYRKLKTKPKTITELKESLQVIWSNLPQGPIDKTVKDFSN